MTVAALQSIPDPLEFATLWGTVGPAGRLPHFSAREARVAIAQAIRRQREALRLSQKQLGARLKTSQPRVARIERAASDVSLDQLVRAFTAAGGKLVVKSATARVRKGKRSPTRAGGTVTLEVALTD